jgi:hypothetical protein
MFVHFTRHLQRSFFTRAPLIRPLFDMDIQSAPLAEFRTLVFNQHPWPLPCSTLRLQLPVTGSMFYPHPCHHELIGTELYDYYGFICRPSVHHLGITASLRA